MTVDDASGHQGVADLPGPGLAEPGRPRGGVDRGPVAQGGEQPAGVRAPDEGEQGRGVEERVEGAPLRVQ